MSYVEYSTGKTILTILILYVILLSEHNGRQTPVSFAANAQWCDLWQVGIVGTTGCGKSSFLLVLLRVLEPRGGRVLLNGVDTRDIGLATLREAMGLVPQELNFESVRSNKV